MLLPAADLRPIRHPRLQGDLLSWTDEELPVLGRRAEVNAWLPQGDDALPATVVAVPCHHVEDAWARRFSAAAWLLSGYAAPPPPDLVAADAGVVPVEAGR